MIGQTAIRLYLLSAVVLATFGIAKWEKHALQPPEVQLPSWTFHEMPLQFGDWRGEDTELDPKITAAVGAAPGRIVDRNYQDRLGHVVSMHTAMFDDPVEGVYHSPLNCYRANGWELKENTREELRLSDDLAIPVSLTTWQREGSRALVVYWYQLGEHVLFGRLDLGIKVRWSLAGKPKWPALVKVMLQIDAADLEEVKATILSFAEQVARWENAPERRTELLLIEDSTNNRNTEPGS